MGIVLHIILSSLSTDRLAVEVLIAAEAAARAGEREHRQRYRNRYVDAHLRNTHAYE